MTYQNYESDTLWAGLAMVSVLKLTRGVSWQLRVKRRVALFRKAFKVSPKICPIKKYQIKTIAITRLSNNTYCLIDSAT